MALESNIQFGAFFAGEDKILSFEILQKGEDPNDAHAAMEDVSAFAMAWALRKAIHRVDPHRAKFATPVITKATGGGGISVTGAYNIDRALNTQRVEVSVAAADDAAIAGGLYVHALNRTDSGAGLVLSFGTVPVLVSAV